MRIRPNLLKTFRGVTEAEYAALSAAAEERSGCDIEDRRRYPAPVEAEASIVGAILWATFVLWQDHPTFVVLGCSGAIISTAYRILDLFK